MRRHTLLAFPLAVVLMGAQLAVALDNGRGITPPRGWRSWSVKHCPAPLLCYRQNRAWQG
jgi:hypothetical protein